MKPFGTYTPTIVILVLVLIATLLPGCGGETTAVPAGSGVPSVLDTSYESALDAGDQLALGTLYLEGTANAVTEDQAAALLPLWQAMQGNELQDNAERDAVLRQIEATMTEAQVAAIAAMQLTQQDAQAWFQDGELAGGLVPASTSQGTSKEQTAPLGGSGSGSSASLIRALVQLLAARSDVAATPVVAQAEEPAALAAEAASPATGTGDLPEAEIVAVAEVVSAAVPEPSSTSEPTPEAAVEPAGVPDAASEPEAEPVVYVVQAGDSLAAIASAYGVSKEAIVEANDIQDPNLIDVGQELVIPDPTRVPQQPAAQSSPAVQDTTVAAAASLPALEQIPDTDPGPPLAIEVSANRALQDLLVAKSETYQVTGIVRNDGDQTYALSAVHVTFFDASGFRGTYEKFPGRGQTGGEWIWHGVTEADVACLLLAPGEEWPFSVQITAQDMASFLIHPDAEPTGRESGAVALSDVRLIDDGSGYVRITGTATNTNPFKVKNVTVSGVLVDASGQIVSLGSTYVLQENVEPGAAVAFDLRVAKEAYTSYHLYAQAERDWN
jgi:LysM repeat protein